MFKMFRNAKHLCFNAWSDHCTMMDTISFISWLPEVTTALRLFKKVSHTMLRMAKNLNALQHINEYKQRQTKYSFFYFSNEANNKINWPTLENSRATNSRVLIGVSSKLPKLKTSIFRTAGQPFIRWIRVIRSMSNLFLNCNHCISIISHIFWTPANKVRKTTLNGLFTSL